MRRAFTLVECMVAAGILGFIVLALFEGVIVATKIAHENADLLAAEAVAWDAVWKRFNEDFDSLAVGTTVETLDQGLSADKAVQAPQLAHYDTEPVLTVTVGYTDETGFSRAVTTMKKITADLEWGPAAHRRSLSGYGQCPQAFRGSLGRTN